MSLARHFVARGLRLWILARLMIIVSLALAAASAGRLVPADAAALVLLAPPAALVVVPLTAGLGFLDVARRHERALLGNFGVSRRRLAAWFGAPAAAGELAVALVGAVVVGVNG